jgi:hypothetical protein
MLGETILNPDFLSTSNSFSSCIILFIISFYLKSPPLLSLLSKGIVKFEVGVIPSEKIREMSGFVFEMRVADLASVWLRYPELLRRLKEQEFDFAFSIEARSTDSLWLTSIVFEFLLP